jgi:glycosyltransferase involved in cell wall biosynthesis
MACGGVESFVLDIGGYLRARGCSVDVLTTQSPGKQFGDIAQRGLRDFSLPCSPFTIPILHSRRIACWLRKQRYDVIFNNQCALTHLVAGQLADDCTVVTMIHGNVNWLFKEFLKNEDAINLYVGVSPAIIRHAQNALTKRPVVHIPHGVDVPETITRTNQCHPSRRQVDLLYAGRLEDEDKGVLFLPEILAHLRNHGVSALLRVAGTGSCRDRLLAISEAHRVNAQLQLLGYMSRSQLYWEYRHAHILLFPSRHEGFGLSLIEAMAHGCVPVASLISGVTDSIIAHGRDGILIPIGDVPAFARGITRLCDNPEEWASMGKAGRGKVEQKYSFQTMGEAYWRIVGNAVNGEYALSTPRHLLPNYNRKLLRPRHLIPGWLLQLLVKFSLHRGLAAIGIHRLWHGQGRKRFTAAEPSAIEA